MSEPVHINDYPERDKDLSLILDWSGDVIASYSLAKNYDIKSIAHAIDRLFNPHE